MHGSGAVVGLLDDGVEQLGAVGVRHSGEVVVEDLAVQSTGHSTASV